MSSIKTKSLEEFYFQGGKSYQYGGEVPVILFPDPSPSPSPTPQPSQTSTPTPTPSITSTNTPTPSITRTITPTASITPTLTKTPTLTPSITISPTQTTTPTPTPTTYTEPIGLNFTGLTATSSSFTGLFNYFGVADLEAPSPPSLYYTLNCSSSNSMFYRSNRMIYYSSGLDKFLLVAWTNSFQGFVCGDDVAIGGTGTDVEMEYITIGGNRFPKPGTYPDYIVEFIY